MPHESILFGTELRRRRTEAGLSLTGLAKLVHYSRSHLGKVETGGKPPSWDLARRCDAVLACGGELARLAGPPTVDDSTMTTGDSGEVWVLSLDANGTDQFGSYSRREVIAGSLASGLAGLVGWAGSGAAATASQPAPAIPAQAALDSSRAIFDQLRRLGQQLDATVLVPILVAHTHTLRKAAAGAGPAERDGLLRLGARYAEYTGWMAQEMGDDQRALWWTDLAVEMAADGGDQELAAYAFVRRALVTLYRDDPAETIAMARHAQSTTSHQRIEGLAAQREAQGHALAGDATASLRAIDRAARLLARAPADDGPVIGTSHVADPVTLVKGWCLFDLGQPAKAAEVLHRGLQRIPEAALRSRTRFGARLAVAYASSGEIEQACLVAQPVLDTYQRIRSATIRTDLRSLARILNRWQSHAAVRDTRLRLTAALSTATR